MLPSTPNHGGTGPDVLNGAGGVGGRLTELRETFADHRAFERWHRTFRLAPEAQRSQACRYRP